MRKLQPRELTLLALLAGVGIAMLWFKDASIGPEGPVTTTEARAREVGEVPVVRLDRLAADADEYDPDGRNLFQYYTPPPPPPRAQPVARVVEPPPQPMVVTPPPTFVPPPPEPPKPPPIQFTYVGLIGPKWKKIAVFDPGGGEALILARVGEVIEGQFKVVDFGYDSVVMGFTDERFRDQTVELRQVQTKTAGPARGRRRPQ